MGLNRHLLQYAITKAASVKQADEEPARPEHIGPYSADQAALVQGLDPMIAVMKRNRKEHPYHYAMNPFVRGPLSELYWRLRRRTAASAGSRNPVEKAYGASLGAPMELVGLGVGMGGMMPLAYAHPSTWISAALGHEGKRKDLRKRLAESGILEQYQQD